MPAQQRLIWFIFQITYHRCFSTGFLMEVGAKYEHSLTFFLYLRRNFNRTTSSPTKHLEFFCTVFSSLRLWVLENDLLPDPRRAVTGSRQAPGDSGGGGGCCFSFSTLASPSFQGPLYPNDSQSWLVHWNQLGSLYVCLKRTCSCILIF